MPLLPWTWLRLISFSPLTGSLHVFVNLVRSAAVTPWTSYWVVRPSGGSQSLSHHIWHISDLRLRHSLFWPETCESHVQVAQRVTKHKTKSFVCLCKLLKTKCKQFQMSQAGQKVCSGAGAGVASDWGTGHLTPEREREGVVLFTTSAGQQRYLLQISKFSYSTCG